VAEERRNQARRAEVLRKIISNVSQNPSVTLSVDTLRDWLQVPVDAAERILTRLASSGLVREVKRGVWVRGTWPGAQREWY
jgi:predicted AAA+ superfamily ATPase